MNRVLLYLTAIAIAGCEIGAPKPRMVTDTLSIRSAGALATPDSATAPAVADHTIAPPPDSATVINTGQTSPEALMRFAETLLGTPYVWASSDPAVGFDCSGFITYVFTHFNISVPRSSVDFTDVGRTVDLPNARRGDFILFTGTDPQERNIGHMGLVVSNDAGGLRFIHATSGKAMGVTITPLTEQYLKRFVRVSRIF